MKKITLPASLMYLLAASAMSQNANVPVNKVLPGLVETYKGLHAHPELSHHEEHTAALLAVELRKSGYTATERVGKYPLARLV